MRNQPLSQIPAGKLSFGRLLSGLLLLGAAACSTGTTDDTADVRVRCINGDAFCVISCDLGCGQTGCSVTEIAENQKLRWVFSDRIDPASVNGASVSIRTTTGVVPDGDLLVKDRELTFAPRVRTVNGVSTFGFLRNESYVITLGDAASGQGVRSISGAGLKRQVSCTVLVSRGIQDEDQLPPTVELVAPANTVGVPLQPTVVLRFSELIDTTALQGALSASSPVQFLLKGTTSVGGSLVCDSLQAGTALQGIPVLSTERVGDRDVTVLSFTVPLELPGNACLTVNVTADVRDLSGRQGVPASFELLTTSGTSQPITVTETFGNSNNQDLSVSSSAWNAGARPGLIGNDGRHGSFDVALGVPKGGGTYEWNTDSFVIPAARSLTGLEYLVTDGKFYFSDFVLPENTTLKFVGTVPPQIWVRGSADIRGTIDISAADMPFWIPTSGPAAGQRVQDFNALGPSYTYSVTVPNFADGQPGGAGGIGGGRGGAGAQECRLDGDVVQTIGLEVVHIYYGRRGEDVKVPAGHAYTAATADTGGKGSLLHPLAGNTLAASTPLLGFLYRGNFTPGGGGGGFSGPGGLATFTPLTGASISTVQPGGGAFALLPLPTPLPSGFSSLNHFVVGGSGGGGGGSHAFGTQNNASIGYYVAGSGGSGGGGAMAIRAGGDVTVAATANLLSKGGEGVLITGDTPSTPLPDAFWGVSSPGGGGSGGSFLLQAGRTLVCNGNINVSGGAGSRTGSISILSTGTPAAFNIVSQAGAGAPGFYRLESGIGLPVFTGTAVPAYNAANNAGLLIDRDALSGSMSKWRSSGRFFPPQWLRYELDVDLDGNGSVDTTFTDSGLPGTMKASDPNGPVRILFQGARLNQAGDAPLPGVLPIWRDGIGSGSGPGINLDSVTGFRFQLLFNRTMFPDTVVRGLRVYAQT
ncbi:MAG: hypothetical protein JNM25_12060 [Planctomycetes bacterium]|nr:hypothetical protein [Planctomycetota bacterium]